MTYTLPLEDRQRLAAKQKARYWSDADFRLKCINRDRVRKGKPPIASLAEMGRQDFRRDAKGRFVRA